MGITIAKRGTPPRFNAEGIAREIQRFAPGAIVERVGRGLDVKGKPFAPYSKRYRNKLQGLGEDLKVDLRVSGGLMNSVKARDATLRADSVEVVIAPDTGTSPVWAKRKGTTGRASRVLGKQGPPHNIVGYWLHFGTPTMRARPWMGLDPKQEAYLRERIAKIMWK